MRFHPELPLLILGLCCTPLPAQGSRADLLATLPAPARERATADPAAFMALLDSVLADDPMHWRLVDKTHPLAADYEPQDLIVLDGIKDIKVNKAKMYLRAATLDAFRDMAAAARKDGVILDISSAYRSYTYQTGLFQRYADKHGVKEAERFSARAGTSQHQLGTAIDFGSVDQSYAKTKGGKWLAANAARYGFSLSYPADGEGFTGYLYEPWHYRYVGGAASQYIDRYFAGVQQHALVWLHQHQDAIRAVLAAS